MTCDNGVITVNVISGNAVSYEIMEGPVTAPPQDSNIFNDLPPGLYQVRVYDNCDDAVVVSVQITNINPNLFIGGGQYVSQDCDGVIMQNYYSSDTGTIFWPLTFEYTVYPPGGGTPQTITQEVNTGSNFGNSIDTEIPYYEGWYSYSIQITDACGNVYSNNSNTVNASLYLSWQLLNQYDPCSPNGLLLDNFENIYPPITVDFLDAPPGFDPEYYNADHPDFDVTYIPYQQPGELIPAGEYTVMITDSCGREFTKTIEVSSENEGFGLEPIYDSCGNGGIVIYMAGKAAVVKEMLAGPEEFSDSYPVNFTGNILPNFDINLHNLPPGDYTIHVIDECGFEHIQDVTVDDLPVLQPIISQIPGCDEDYGSIRIIPNGSTISEAYITEAPPAYTDVLPSNIISNLNTDIGYIFINSLPEGNYKFELTTECGILTIDYVVEGYEVYVNEYEIAPHCGAFDLFINHASNNNYSYEYWLQKYDEETDTWGHPLTGVPYDEDNGPSSLNGVWLFDWLNPGLPYTGYFRVIKSYDTYGDGQSPYKECTDIIHEFTFSGAPDILAAYSFPCDDNTAEVILVAEGIPPLNYSITTQNGQPFSIDNGQSPHFLGLDPGLYNFRVTDDCGNIRNIVFDINTLEPLAIQPQGFCDGQDSSLLLPDFTFLIYEWWKEGAPGTILSTDNNLLFPAFDPGQDTGTYMVHVTSLTPGSCIDILLEYTVTPNGLPNAGEDTS
ncbi:MAG TPA: hypothetical protein VEA37_10990, partial [Flavobacterium sp.]|nr:hypothetical protein [Flavobacterium sp.]